MMSSPKPTLALASFAALVVAGHPLAGQEWDVVSSYQMNCASCHGDDLAGGSAPSMLDDTWAHGGSDAQIARNIRDGLPDNGMPAWEGVLSDAQIRAMVVFIREQQTAAARKATDTAVRSDRTYSAAGHRFHVEDVASGLDTPWSIAFLPDRRMIVTEKTGGVRIVEQGKPGPRIAGTPAVLTMSQAGMMEVAPHPQFKDNGWIYLAFSEPLAPGSREGMTAIVRGRIRDGKWVDQERIYRAPDATFRGAGHHWGTRLAFDDKGYLFFPIGDRGAQEQAQRLDRPNGKVHRIHDDGRVPDDNPFVGQREALPTIWSYGHRNPQGLDFNPVDGRLWSTEHGPRGGDELNLVQRSRNYGWPVITYGINYNGTPITDRTQAEGMEQPVIHWTPSIAVCGLDFYEGDAFPNWRGGLLVGALAGQEVRLVKIDGANVTGQETLFRRLGRVRDVQCGPDGYVYVALNGPDKIVRLVPAAD